jgi:hypothetical protein
MWRLKATSKKRLKATSKKVVSTMKLLAAVIVVPGTVAVLLAPHASADTTTYLRCLKADEIDGYPFDDNTAVKIGIEVNHAMGGVARPDLGATEITTLMQKYNLSYHQASSVVNCATGSPPNGV